MTCTPRTIPTRSTEQFPLAPPNNPNWLHCCCRAALARVAGEIARKWGDHRCPGMVTVNLEGSAGQSFAAFVVNGMDIKLVGEANDYVGKGMAGGTVTIVPPPNAGFVASEASIVGNTCLYGATGGKLFVNGRAGALCLPPCLTYVLLA